MARESKRGLATKVKKQFHYIAFAKEGRRSVIKGWGKSPQSAKTSAAKAGADSASLQTTLAARAVCEAFVQKGAKVRFTISPVNGRASLA